MHKAEAVLVRDRFPASDPPTLSTRGHSGGFIKRRVIVAMSEQHEAFKEAYAALDHLLAVYKARYRKS